MHVSKRTDITVLDLVLFPKYAPSIQLHFPVPALPHKTLLILPQTLPNTLPTPLPEILVLPLLLLAKHARRLEVGRALVVRVLKQADDANEDRLGRLHGTPPLAGRLVPVLVLLWRVQDADTQLTVRVDVGVERDRRLEDQLGRHERVGWREGQVRAEVAS